MLKSLARQLTHVLSDAKSVVLTTLIPSRLPSFPPVPVLVAAVPRRFFVVILRPFCKTVDCYDSEGRATVKSKRAVIQAAEAC